MTLTLRTGADAWLEVVTEQGRFFVPFDCSAFALVEQIIKGGHWVEPLGGSAMVSHRRGIGAIAAARSGDSEETSS